MKLESRTQFAFTAALVALAMPSVAGAYECTQNGANYTQCVPPKLESVEKDSFSFVFKVDDRDQATGESIVVSLYNDTYGATNSPASCITVANSKCWYNQHDAGDTSQHACYHKVSSSSFGVPLAAGTQYAYNVNVGGSCTHHSDGTYSISGGEWFNSRRYVRTAPSGRPSTISFAIIGDTRDGDQDDCDAGTALFTYGDILSGHNCGGSAGQRSNFAGAVATNAPSFIIHTGDISLTDSLSHTFLYWRDIGSPWQDISTTFAYGNHEFDSEEFGTHNDTVADDFIAPPATPAGYPPSTGVTYYAQNWGNVHVVYLNSQSCVLESYNAGATCPSGQTPQTKYAFGSNDQFSCGCNGYSYTQRDWLERDLKQANADPNIDFIIVTEHKPFWSNGSDAYHIDKTTGDSVHDGSKANGAWTNTLAREEYALAEGSGNNLSPLGGYAVASDGSGWLMANMRPLDAILQMYNVDLLISSHAHYYERLTDHRYRASDDPGLPHLIIGGGGSPEQAYQCPQATNCTAKSRSYPMNHLPNGVEFNYGTDGNFYFGRAAVSNATHAMQIWGVKVDDENFIETNIDQFAGSGIVSRKSQIRAGGAHSGATDPFNGCNLDYDTNSNPPVGFAGNGVNQPPFVIPNVNCVVN